MKKFQFDHQHVINFGTIEPEAYTGPVEGTVYLGEKMGLSFANHGDQAFIMLGKLNVDEEILLEIDEVLVSVSHDEGAEQGLRENVSLILKDNWAFIQLNRSVPFQYSINFYLEKPEPYKGPIMMGPVSIGHDLTINFFFNKGLYVQIKQGNQVILFAEGELDDPNPTLSMLTDIFHKTVDEIFSMNWNYLQEITGVKAPQQTA